MNKPIVIGSLAIFSLLFLYLMTDLGILPSLHKDSVNKNGIGEITATSNSVQLKENGSLYWLDAKPSNQLQYYDSILTFENSKSQISLKDGTKIEIDPDTLIVLEAPDKNGGELKLVIIRGSAKVIGDPKRVSIVEKPEPIRFVAQVLNVDEELAPEEPQAPVVEIQPEIVLQEKPVQRPIIVVIDESPPEPMAKTVVQIKPPKIEAPRPRPWWIWAGLGMNYVDYAQTVSSLSDVSYQVVKGPSYFLRAGRFFNNSWGFDLSFKDSPGVVTGGESISVSNGDYHWRTITAEVLKVIFDDKFKIFNLSNFMNLRLGVQQHYMPFIVIQNSTSAQVRQNSLTMASLGFDYVLNKRKKLSYEIQGRYQYPVAAKASDSNTYAVSPKFAFDGSLGLIYKFTDALNLGTYWYGQWHTYDFTYFDSVGNTTNTGSQSFFYSNAELRLGIMF